MYSLTRYLSFRGRLARSQYWVWYAAPLWLGGWLVAFAGAGVLTIPIALVLGWVGIVGAVKRLHDLDYSVTVLVGAWLATIVGASLAGPIPILGYVIGGIGAFMLSLLTFALYFVRGTKGDNRFGADPLEGTRGW